MSEESRTETWTVTGEQIAIMRLQEEVAELRRWVLELMEDQLDWNI